MRECICGFSCATSAYESWLSHKRRNPTKRHGLIRPHGGDKNNAATRRRAGGRSASLTPGDDAWWEEEEGGGGGPTSPTSTAPGSRFLAPPRAPRAAPRRTRGGDQHPFDRRRLGVRPASARSRLRRLRRAAAIPAHVARRTDVGRRRRRGGGAGEGSFRRPRQQWRWWWWWWKAGGRSGSTRRG